MVKCAYRGERIREIEEKWVDENEKDEEKRRRRKKILYYILAVLGDKVDCRLEAVSGKEFCMFHDSEHCKSHEDEVKEEFLKRLKEDEERFFIGFYLPGIEFPKVVEKEVHMGLAKFHGPLKARTTFKEVATFEGATFEEEASFENAIFEKGVWFGGTTFKEAMSFEGATFEGRASFDNATFEEGVWFDKATFKGVASFDKAVFKGAWFAGTTFKVASFKESTFKGVASFGVATFEEAAWFTKVTFKVAWFNDVTFQGEASFAETTFREEALFDRTTFEVAWFNGATFKGIAWFNRTIFIGKVTFDDSISLGRILFKDSVFLPDLLVKYLDPESYISFRRVSFRKEGSQDQGEIVFDGCNMRRVSFIHTDMSKVRFRNVDWDRDFRVYDEKLLLLKEEEKERKIFIKECRKKLERIRDVLSGKKRDEEIEREINLEPRIHKVLEGIGKLSGEKKPLDEKLDELSKKKERSEEEEKYFKELNRETGELNKKLEELNERFEELKGKLRSEVNMKIKDLKYKKNLEKLESLSDEDLKLDNVLAVYRSLRDNHDYYLKYEESGRFFVNEMKLRRRLIGKEEIRGSRSGKARKRVSNLVEKLAMWSYELLALYGESYVQPILWTVVLILMFSLIRPLMLQNFSLGFILKEMRISLLAFFQLHWDLKTLTVIERLVSIPVLGTLVIALRRKLERRIRH